MLLEDGNRYCETLSSMLMSSLNHRNMSPCTRLGHEHSLKAGEGLLGLCSSLRRSWQLLSAKGEDSYFLGVQPLIGYTYTLQNTVMATSVVSLTTSGINSNPKEG